MTDTRREAIERLIEAKDLIDEIAACFEQGEKLSQSDATMRHPDPADWMERVAKWQNRKVQGHSIHGQLSFLLRDIASEEGGAA